MKLAFFLYITDFIHNIDLVLNIIMVFYAIFLATSIFAWCVTNDDYSKESHAVMDKVFKTILSKWWIMALSTLISVAIPTQRTMYLMLGSVYLSESNLPKKVSEALELKLDDIIKEMKVGNNKKE